MSALKAAWAELPSDTIRNYVRTYTFMFYDAWSTDIMADLVKTEFVL